MELERWPIDYDEIEKGDVIQVERVEQITGKKFGTDEYSFAVLKLKERIERELHDRDKRWTLCTERGAIKILTDQEAVSYNDAAQVSARAAMVRRLGLQQAIDVSKLDSDTKRFHERSLENNGKYVQAILTVRKQISLRNVKRDVPGLPEVSSV